MRPVFADPKTDFVFKRIFGTEDHKDLLVALLNNLLELDEAHHIVDVQFLPADQRPPVQELKYSIVDVKCIDAAGTTYVVEMQVLQVEGFEKRVVYNVAKAFTSQIGVGEGYPQLNDVIGITICDFDLWPQTAGFEIPMLSHWRMQEQHVGARGLSQLQFVFLELPKYAAGDNPEQMVDKWAYFFREAKNLQVIPPALSVAPLRGALEAARTAGFSEPEWDAYIRAGMAIQDERGALSFARKAGLREGEQKGLREGLRAGLLIAINAVCDALGVQIDEAKRDMLQKMSVDEMDRFLAKLRQARAWPD